MTEPRDTKPGGVACIVQDEHGCYVIGTRTGTDNDAGKFAFPGGKIDAGETPGEAAVRELFEETGLRAHVIRVGPIVKIPERAWRHVAVFLELDPPGQVPQSTKELTAVHWVPIYSVILDNFFTPSRVVWEAMEKEKGNIV